jgi:formylmethanofuran dehydrogenase subunit D
VVVTARSDATGEPGVGFMPFSLYTNRLASYEPGSSTLSGKHIEARVMPAEKGITPVADLIVRRNRA